MDKTSEKLTVYFEEPFWVGIFERISGGMLTVCKVTFGAEPKDYEVQEFILKHYSRHCSGSGKNQRLNAGGAERDRRRQRSSESLI